MTPAAAVPRDQASTRYCPSLTSRRRRRGPAGEEGAATTPRKRKRMHVARPAVALPIRAMSRDRRRKGRPLCCSGPKKPALKKTACGEGCCAEAEGQEEERDGCTGSCCEEAERAEDGKELLGREQMHEADVGNDDSQCACTSSPST